jgi:acyl-CoA synthetase (AMP-forming)/AMP-acid ligase II
MLFTTPKIGLHDNRPLLARLAKNPGSVNEVVILRGKPGRLTSYGNLVELGGTTSEDKLAEVGTQVGTYDVCNLQFTSGTTGHPKAAMLTHQ